MTTKLKISMIALMLLMIGQGASAWDGSGTEKAPYEISTIAELNELAANVNAGTSYSGIYFKLIDDLDYSEVSVTNGCNYTPIGWGDNKEGKAFSGIFDGNKKTIRGITYNKPTEWGVGVFGYISKASIKDLTVENCTFIANGFVGGICGCSDKVNSNLNPTIENCHVASSVTLGATDFAVGGIIGINEDNLTIKDCTSAAVITSTDEGVGGIIGVAYEDVYMATITDSYYIGSANMPAIGENGGHKDAMVNYATINITLLNDDSGAAVKNTTRISNYAGMSVNVTLSGRTLWKDGSWNTLCLPFGLTIAGSPLAGDDVDLRTLSSAAFSDDIGMLTLNFTEAGALTSILAGTPYIIKWDNTGVNLTESNLVFNGVTISSGMSDVECDLGSSRSVTFKGTYSKQGYTDEDRSVLFLSTDNNLYYPSGENPVSIGAMRAYFQLNGIKAGEDDIVEPGPGIKQFVLNFGDEETGISDLTPNPSPKGEGSWYDLSGRKVANGPLGPRGRFTLEEKPKANGLYIVNGKKVVVK